ncbi:MAG: hypothetical protein DHS20C13_07310 [Thermodesulfobacteriota bacterium]|nr:MAG: hypothetical protein DHS20C13_07310 [Thermodesulfobacteriota bacterium]
MVKRLLILPVLVLSLLIISFEANADVIVDDADSDTEVDMNSSFNSADVPTGSGQIGDYVLIVCSISPFFQDPPVFSAPTPGTWTQLDTGQCGSGNDCSHGIWGRFTDNPASEDITCSWDDPGFVFAAGSFRYNNVDVNDPIVDVGCNSGTGNDAIAPSIETVAGSQVVRVFTYTNLDFPLTSDTNSNTDTEGQFSSFASTTFQTVSLRATTDLFISDGPTGTANNFSGTEPSWRACTIALRMAPVQRNVPTMSEWGLISFAAFAGITGLWFIRRRQLAA